VEVVLEGGLLRSAATAWGKLTQVQFDTETRRQDASSADSSGYVGATFRLQPT